MKRIFFYILSAVLFMGGCYKDKGNYRYAENEVITTTGIEARYNKIYLQDRLVIDPEVKSTVPGAEFEYFWTISTSKETSKDTVSHDKKLDIPIDRDPNKTYWLVFGATNKNTGITAYTPAELIINTPFSYGFYVLKDDGKKSDVDLYNSDGSVFNNIINYVNEEQGIGKAIRLSYSSNTYVFDEESNSYKKIKVVNVMTDRGLIVLDASLASIVRKDQQCFFEQQSVISPAFMGESTYSQLLISNGKVYSISNQSSNSGKYGMSKKMPGGAESIISKYVHNDYLGHHLVFDENSSSFMFATNALNELLPAVDGSGTELSCSNNNKSLLYLGARAPYYDRIAFAVMEDKTDGKRLIARVDLNQRNKYIVSMTAENLDETDPAAHAQMYTVSLTEEVLYFISEGALWCRNVAGKDGVNTKQFTIPDGERVTLVKSLKYKEAGVIDLNHVVVATTDGSGYKLRLFAKTTAGNLNPSPDFEFPRDGFAPGTVADVMYNSPKQISMTTIYSY